MIRLFLILVMVIISSYLNRLRKVWTGLRSLRWYTWKIVKGRNIRYSFYSHVLGYNMAKKIIKKVTEIVKKMAGVKEDPYADYEINRPGFKVKKVIRLPKRG
jgi:predicted membrane-bound dolichyl-phosphate-mannose-protein mannosyltransferase